MASNPCVFEVMIHHVEADTLPASVLQKRLCNDGIRTSVTHLSATKATSAFDAARHSLCFVGSAFTEEDAAHTPYALFDSVFIASNVRAAVPSSKGYSSYEALVEHLLRSSEGAPMNAPQLRRMTQESYDNIATQFTDVWFDAIPGEAIEKFLEHLRHGATILDAGCGPGHHARFFKKAGFDPVGLDFSRSMLNIAAEKNPHIPFHHGDILSHPLPKAGFDGVWSAVALNHIPSEEVPLALSNLVATLKDEGFIGLNFQIGRPSEIVQREKDHRFFEYPVNEDDIIHRLEALGIQVVGTHLGTTTRNTHGLPLDLRFATVVGWKRGIGETRKTPQDIAIEPDGKIVEKGAT